MFAVAGQPGSEVRLLKLVSPAYSIEKSEGYHRITMEGFSAREVSGAPRLPQQSYEIELPLDAELTTLQMRISSKSAYMLAGEYEVAPCPLPIMGYGTMLSDSIVDGKGKDIYESDRFYPSTPVEILGTWQTGDKKVVKIQFTPFQYNPVTKKLHLTEEVDVRFWWKREIPEPRTQKRIKDGYAIVTTNAIVSNSSVLRDFTVHLRSKEFEVYVVTEDQYGTATGQQRAIDIRKWLKANYLSLNVKYVLLIGNPDPDDPSRIDNFGDIPMMMCWPDIYEASPEKDFPVPTDYFYADLTGNWDSDGDGFYGEYLQDTVDFIPEVYVGRIPVYHGDYATLDKILNKTFFYRCCGRKILLPMALLMYEDENGDEGNNRMDGRNLPQRIIENIADPDEYDYCVMYERKGLSYGNLGTDPVPINAFGFTKPLSEENIIEEWEKGYGIAFWWAYGEPDQGLRRYWYNDDGDKIPQWNEDPKKSEMRVTPFMTSETEVADTDTFTFQCSGNNGSPEEPNNLGYKLLQRGAICTVSASRFVIVYKCNWDTKNDVDSPTIGYNYIYRLVRYGEPAGKALYSAKSSLTNNLGDGGWRNLFCFNLYGDPSLTVMPYDPIDSPTRIRLTCGRRPGYAIITTEDIKNNSSNFRRFVIHLRSRGFEVYTVTEKMYGTATGQKRAINIRKWLKANYLSLNVRYVLLIGDPDPEDPSGSHESLTTDPDGGFGDIPMMMCWPDIYEADTSLDYPIPTDYFYADLTGDWDSDGDGFYGEPFQDDIDLVPEVYVGRIPVYHGDYASLDKILNKTISYQCCNKRMLFLMAISNFANEDNDSGPRVDGRHLPEIAVKTIAIPKGYNYHIMYEGEGLSPSTDAFGFTKPLNEKNVIEEWENGYGIVFWWAHGNAQESVRRVWIRDDGDSVPEWNNNELEAPAFLTSDTNLPEGYTFTFQASCGNGHPEFPDSLGMEKDNLGYALLKRGSAICTVSASRCTLYLMCFWDYENDTRNIRRDTDEATIGYWYIYYLVKVGEPAGKALYAAKSKLGKPGDYGNIFAFNLYGDPSLAVESCGPPEAQDPYWKLSRMWASTMIRKARGLLEEARKLLGEAKSAGHDVSEIESMVYEAEVFLKESERYYLKESYGQALRMAVDADKLLEDSIEKLNALL